MIDDRDDGQQWRNEYEEWAEEQERQDMERLNALLRAARDGTIYDTREEPNAH